MSNYITCNRYTNNNNGITINITTLRPTKTYKYICLE